jgi:hypothetical protein
MYVRTEPTTHCVCSLKTKHASRHAAPSTIVRRDKYHNKHVLDSMLRLVGLILRVRSNYKLLERRAKTDLIKYENNLESVI